MVDQTIMQYGYAVQQQREQLEAAQRQTSQAQLQFSRQQLQGSTPLQRQAIAPQFAQAKAEALVQIEGALEQQKQVESELAPIQKQYEEQLAARQQYERVQAEQGARRRDDATTSTTTVTPQLSETNLLKLREAIEKTGYVEPALKEALKGSYEIGETQRPDASKGYYTKYGFIPAAGVGGLSFTNIKDLMADVEKRGTVPAAQEIFRTQGLDIPTRSAAPQRVDIEADTLKNLQAKAALDKTGELNKFLQNYNFNPVSIYIPTEANKNIQSFSSFVDVRGKKIGPAIIKSFKHLGEDVTDLGEDVGNVVVNVGRKIIPYVTPFINIPKPGIIGKSIIIKAAPFISPITGIGLLGQIDIKKAKEFGEKVITASLPYVSYLGPTKLSMTNLIIAQKIANPVINYYSDVGRNIMNVGNIVFNAEKKIGGAIVNYYTDVGKDVLKTGNIVFNAEKKVGNYILDSYIGTGKNVLAAGNIVFNNEKKVVTKVYDFMKAREDFFPTSFPEEWKDKGWTAKNIKEASKEGTTKIVVPVVNYFKDVGKNVGKSTMILVGASSTAAKETYDFMKARKEFWTGVEPATPGGIPAEWYNTPIEQKAPGLQGEYRAYKKMESTTAEGKNIAGLKAIGDTESLWTSYGIVSTPIYDVKTGQTYYQYTNEPTWYKELAPGFETKTTQEGFTNYLVRGFSQTSKDISSKGFQKLLYSPKGTYETLSPEAEKFGKFVGTLSTAGLYTVPMLSQVLIYGGSAEAIYKGNIIQYAKENPWEVGAAATFGAATGLVKGYQAYRFFQPSQFGTGRLLYKGGIKDEFWKMNKQYASAGEQFYVTSPFRQSNIAKTLGIEPILFKGGKTAFYNLQKTQPKLYANIMKELTMSRPAWSPLRYIGGGVGPGYTEVQAKRLLKIYEPFKTVMASPMRPAKLGVLGEASKQDIQRYFTEAIGKEKGNLIVKGIDLKIGDKQIQRLLSGQAKETGFTLYKTTPSVKKIYKNIMFYATPKEVPWGLKGVGKLSTLTTYQPTWTYTTTTINQVKGNFITKQGTIELRKTFYGGIPKFEAGKFIEVTGGKQGPSVIGLQQVGTKDTITKWATFQRTTRPNVFKIEWQTATSSQKLGEALKSKVVSTEGTGLRIITPRTVTTNYKKWVDYYGTNTPGDIGVKRATYELFKKETPKEAKGIGKYISKDIVVKDIYPKELSYARWVESPKASLYVSSGVERRGMPQKFNFKQITYEPGMDVLKEPRLSFKTKTYTISKGDYYDKVRKPYYDLYGERTGKNLLKDVYGKKKEVIFNSEPTLKTYGGKSIPISQYSKYQQSPFYKGYMKKLDKVEIIEKVSPSYVGGAGGPGSESVYAGRGGQMFESPEIIGPIKGPQSGYKQIFNQLYNMPSSLKISPMMDLVKTNIKTFASPVVTESLTAITATKIATGLISNIEIKSQLQTKQELDLGLVQKNVLTLQPILNLDLIQQPQLKMEQRLEQTLVQVPALVQVPISVIKPIQVSSAPSRLSQPTPAEPRITIPVPIILGKKRKELDQLKKLKPIKTVIPFGRRRGKFFALSKPTTIEGARSKGFEFLKSTLGATFEVRTPKGERVVIAKDLGREYLPGKKGRDIFQIVQKPSFRLGTRSERMEIKASRRMKW